MPEHQPRPGARIAFVIPFVGKWPPWSRLFFESARDISNVDFIIHCTHPIPFPTAANIHTVAADAVDISERMQRALGVGLGRMISGHKLCDLRPFAGLIFSDVLRGYDFWGYCDVDMMMGDISRLFTDDFFASVDVFTAHPEICVGHFSVFRNCDRVNRLCLKIDGWKEKCGAPVSRHMDENGIAEVLRHEDGLRVVRSQGLRQELESGFSRHGITFGMHGEVAYLVPPNDIIVRWEGGRAIAEMEDGSEREALYIHFMGTKRWWHWLWFRNGVGPVHIFSKIGYGGIRCRRDLAKPQWRAFYRLQSAFHAIKVTVGAGLSPDIS